MPVHKSLGRFFCGLGQVVLDLFHQLIKMVFVIGLFVAGLKYIVFHYNENFLNVSFFTSCLMPPTM